MCVCVSVVCVFFDGPGGLGLDRRHPAGMNFDREPLAIVCASSDLAPTTRPNLTTTSNVLPTQDTGYRYRKALNLEVSRNFASYAIKRSHDWWGPSLIYSFTTGTLFPLFNQRIPPLTP